MRNNIIAFYLAFRHRFYHFQKHRFLDAYLRIFLHQGIAVKRFKNQWAWIGDPVLAEQAVVCRFDTGSERLFKTGRYDPLTGKNTADFHQHLIMVLYIMIGIGFITILPYSWRSIGLLLALCGYYGLFARANVHNLSSTLPLFMLTKLNADPATLFIIYDGSRIRSATKLIPDKINRVVYLERFAFGDDIMVASTWAESATAADPHIINQPLDLPKEKGFRLTIIASGINGRKGFYCPYVDTTEDVSLDIRMFKKCLKLLKVVLKSENTASNMILYPQREETHYDHNYNAFNRRETDHRV